MKNYAIILASGFGTRFESKIPKQFTKIGEKTVIEKCVEAFEINDYIDNIIVVTNPNYIEITHKLLSGFKKVVKIVSGGETRRQSSYIGICELSDDANVFIHDCARPFVSQRIINNCALALKKYAAVTTAVSVTDTIIETENDFIKNIPNRSLIKKNQTPQCFRLSLIKKAYEKAPENIIFTDDCSVVLYSKLSDIYVVEGDEKNIKITYSSDLSTNTF